MVKRYPGGVIAPIAPTVNATSAGGFFSSTAAAQYAGANAWPGNTPIAPSTVEYLVVAGGGGGGYGSSSGGGGAGGLRTATGFAVTSGVAITVTVGGGGTAGNASAANGGKGTDSVCSTITSTGGGGGYYNGGTGQAGGIS